VAGTVLGCGHLGLLIWKDVDTDEGAGYFTADVLTTLPELLSVVTINPALAKYAGPVLVGSDIVAAGASIACAIYDAVS
jgi:hypothetical protein